MDASWTCGSCRSLNRPGTTRCYQCGDEPSSRAAGSFRTSIVRLSIAVLSCLVTIAISIVVVGVATSGFEYGELDVFFLLFGVPALMLFNKDRRAFSIGAVTGILVTTVVLAAFFVE